MKATATAFLSVSVLAIGLSAAPVYAQSLLGGVLGGGGGGGIVGGVGNILGGGDDSSNSTAGSVADIDSGPAGNDALANVGLGSGGGNNDNVADVNVGRGSTGGLLGGGLLGGDDDEALANLNISGGNGQGGLLNNGGVLGTGLLDGDDDGGVLGSGILGGSNLTAGLDLGGLDLDLGGLGLGGNGGNGSGGNGNGGNGGAGGNGGVGGNGIGANGRVLVGSVDGSFQVNCSVNDGRKVLQLASQAKLNPGAWQRAANVRVVPVRLCAQARAQVAQIFNASGKIQQLQRAAAGDMLITASLNRTRYDVDDVFAVQASGGNLVVYVY
jgi:hypothetical protein